MRMGLILTHKIGQGSYVSIRETGEKIAELRVIATRYSQGSEGLEKTVEILVKEANNISCIYGLKKNNKTKILPEVFVFLGINDDLHVYSQAKIGYDAPYTHYIHRTDYKNKLTNLAS